MVGLIDGKNGYNANNSALNQAAIGLVEDNQRTSYRDSQGGDKKSMERSVQSQKFILNEADGNKIQPYNQAYEQIKEPTIRDSYRDSVNSNNRSSNFRETAMQNSQPFINETTELQSSQPLNFRETAMQNSQPFNNETTALQSSQPLNFRETTM